jgi:hypothetical protein
MDGPERLEVLPEPHCLIDLFPRMIGSEALVVWGVPVLGGDHQTIEVATSSQAISDRYDFVAPRNRQRTTGHEVQLQVDQDERAFH